VTERKTEFTNNFFFDNVIDILLTQKCTNIKAFKVEKNSFFDVVIMCNVTSNTQMVSSVKKLKNLGRMKIFKNDILVLEIDSYGILKKKEFYNKDDMENIKIVKATTESGFK